MADLNTLLNKMAQVINSYQQQVYTATKITENAPKSTNFVGATLAPKVKGRYLLLGSLRSSVTGTYTLVTSISESSSTGINILIRPVGRGQANLGGGVICWAIADVTTLPCEIALGAYGSAPSDWDATAYIAAIKLSGK